VHVPFGFRLQLSVVEATIPPELILELMRIEVYLGVSVSPGSSPTVPAISASTRSPTSRRTWGSKFGQIG
jgi:hypothetical protein